MLKAISQGHLPASQPLVWGGNNLMRKNTVDAKLANVSYLFCLMFTSGKTNFRCTPKMLVGFHNVTVTLAVFMNKNK